MTLEAALEVAPARSADLIRSAPRRDGRHVEGMLRLQKMGAVTFDYGNNIRTFAFQRGVKNAYGSRESYALSGRCSAKAVARSVGWLCQASPSDIHVTDDWCWSCSRRTGCCGVGSIWPQADEVSGIAGANLLARIRRARTVGLAMNDLVKKSKIKAPIVMAAITWIGAGRISIPRDRKHEDGSDA